MFIVIGVLLGLAGIMGLYLAQQPEAESSAIFVAIFMTILGLVGITGGIGVRLGDPSWSKLAYGMAAVYILAFPIGTILSIVLFIGLDRYLKDIARYREAQAPVMAVR
jgi:hypothetical protein